MGAWWRGRDSDPRPTDYDSGALPTELPRQVGTGGDASKAPECQSSEKKRSRCEGEENALRRGRGSVGARRGRRARHFAASGRGGANLGPERRASPREAFGRFRGLRPARIRSAVRPDVSPRSVLPAVLALRPLRAPDERMMRSFRNGKRRRYVSGRAAGRKARLVGLAGSRPRRPPRRPSDLAARPSLRFLGRVAEGRISLGLPSTQSGGRWMNSRCASQDGCCAPFPDPSGVSLRETGGSAP